jgi:heme-degrading monooxygenase HmoA
MSDQRIYHIDLFKVPATARDEFLERVQMTHQVLRGIPGFVEDAILEQVGESGQFSFITSVVWERADALEVARKAVTEKHQELGFKPGEMFARLGIEVDRANYKSVE